ncbi:MAG: DEAD/DEAH box helicase [Chloroflexi bacterium]|nr:DEAD/DEAH box helicase [Chloroflexota bacterium]
MPFTNLPLSAATLEALAAMNISEPTPIQARALPFLLEGRDLIGQARTGSGKTLAFALPMIERVDPGQRALQAIVLVPTRELAQQVGDVVEAAGKKRGIKTVLVFGGRSPAGQIAQLKAGAHVVVGAPGRVLDLLRQGEIKPDRIRYFVLDEADEMLDRGFAPDVERILGFMPKERQTVLLSATVPDWVEQTASRYLRNPELVAIDTRPEDVPKIEHLIYEVPEGQKLGVLRVLLDRRDQAESALVFGRTKHGVKKLAKQLVALGYPAAALQGNLSQNARDVVMADFRARRVPILLATNVAARGLDVDHIGLVINYELPETTELLTHRVGRTGRMGREGDAVTLLSPSDEDKWRQLAKTLRVKIPRKAWKDPLPATPAAVNAIPLYGPRPERGQRPVRLPEAPRESRPVQARPQQAPQARRDQRPEPARPPQRPARLAPAVDETYDSALDRWLAGLGGSSRPATPRPAATQPVNGPAPAAQEQARNRRRGRRGGRRHSQEARG